MKEPRIYFGEDVPGFAIVGSKQRELDYQKVGGGTETTSYTGKGGVPLGSPFRRAAFALRFGDANVLLSNLITSKSRVIYVRDIKERVQQGGAVPPLRQRPVPGHQYRGADRVDPGRLHHHVGLPVCPAGRDRSSRRRQRAEDVVQLRAQLDQGSDRLLRRDRHLLPGRHEGSDRPGLRQGVPEAVHRRRPDARGPQAAPALSGGAVPGADRDVRPLSHPEPA